MKKNILYVMMLGVILQLGCTGEKGAGIDGKGDNLSLIEVVGEDRDIIDRSEKIADTVVELFGIDNATALILNDKVVVGIVLSHDRELSQEILDTIELLVKENSSEIEEVYITSDPKLFKQIDNMVVEILQGKSYDKYVAKVDKIIDKVKKER